jgi:signal-transduction protein with cAMP-binding, CBS, and nucleotidyltransferase domain
MRDEHIGSLPVTEDERLVGMITDRDISTRVVADSAVPETMAVGDVYSRDLISVEPNNDLEEALQLMGRHQVRRLPVVENGRLVGMVAQADIALKENEKGPVSSSGRSPSVRRESADSVGKSGQHMRCAGHRAAPSVSAMDITIHASFFPHNDPGASLAFYRDTLGFDVHNDVG